MNFFLREAWNEFRAGLRGGVLPLIYVVLTGYILIVMTSADNLQKMGAIDIPRNAPGLVYLMTSGDAFFLFFAWAWIFAQPIVRDRNSHLDEIVLAAPLSLWRLLAARYVGALGVALVIGTSQILGFLLAPVLEFLGAVPAGSVAPAPWMAFGWAALIFTLPLAAGAGALYFIAALRTRGVGGPFAVAALLMAFWMVSMIVFKDGHADPFLVTALDPSGFAEAEHQVIDQWTPHEKSTALLALSPGLLCNRFLWDVLPLLAMGAFIARTTRESLVLGRMPRRHTSQHSGTRKTPRIAPTILPGPITRPVWWRAVAAESAWQARQILARRGLWIALALLVLLALAAAIAHGVHHAYGPMIPRPEYVSPVLTRTFYLIVVFMVAAMVGTAARRDEQSGLAEMFDAAPAPDAVRLIGRAVAAMLITVVCALIPAFGAFILALLASPDSHALLPIVHQLTVLAPAILEMAAITLLLHALIRRPGTAHAAAILAAFIMVVNFEVGLVNYPPLQIGRGVHIALSGLTGFGPWAEKLLAGDLFKIALAVSLLALAAVVNRRGLDHEWGPRLRRCRQRLFGWSGLVAVGGVLALCACSVWLEQRFVTEGGYETEEQRQAKDAAWERCWLGQHSAFSVRSGEVQLTILPDRDELRGRLRMHGVRAAGRELHASLPTGCEVERVRVQWKTVAFTVDNDHLCIPLHDDRASGCVVDIAWRLPAAGWASGDHDEAAKPSWLVGESFWLRAQDVMPRLGFDAERVLWTATDRARLGLPEQASLPDYQACLAHEAVAPSGKWRWKVEIKGRENEALGGSLNGLLDFAALHAPDACKTRVNGVTIIHDPHRSWDARVIAEDLAAMRARVIGHLGTAPNIDTVVQWPRGLPPGALDAAVAGSTLILAEEPHWDVADAGTGRLARRADIAAALAGRVIADAADLRQGQGGDWLGKGLPGALGLVCVAETDGTEALQALLARGAQQATKTLAEAETPVGPLALTVNNAWAAKYAPLATLAWAARLEPADFTALTRTVRRDANIAAALTALFGPGIAATHLGPPQSADLHVVQGQITGARWTWQAGGWQALKDHPAPRGLQVDNGRLVWIREALPSTAALMLDDWPAYEREPKDNMGQQQPR